MCLRTSSKHILYSLFYRIAVSLKFRTHLFYFICNSYSKITYSYV